jgi:hypothetical protein
MARRLFLIVHVALVAILAVVLAVVTGSHDTPDANIGAGLVLLPLIALGLPWSLLYFVLPISLDDASTLVYVLASIAPAVLNIVVVQLVLRWRRRRRSAPA